MGNKLVELESRIRDEERKVLAVLSALVAEEASALNQLVAVLRTLDLALARGRYGRWLGGVAPQLDLDEEAPFSLQGLRHPLLVWQHKRADGPAVVPISVEVSPQLRVVAITGPNTGGKTVTLKSIGLAALMARAGMLLPCSCLLYTSPSPRDYAASRMPSSA